MVPQLLFHHGVNMPTTTKANNSMAWLGFWIFLSVLAVCDTWLFSKGYESILWERKTEAEKQLGKECQNGY
jgi:hypothetical protein